MILLKNKVMKTRYQTSKPTEPIDEKEEVQKSNDKHIDQDFEGYPHNPARENIINPKSREDHVIAGLKDGENISQKNKGLKKTRISQRNKQNEEISSDGSANAFERTEGMPDKSEWKHDKLKIDERSKVY